MANGRGKLDANLRRRAAERLRERKLADNLPLRDPDRAVHELEVHQCELEIQNEELQGARVELELALTRYVEIFHLAPIGYLTITPEGLIRELNHAAALLFTGFPSPLAGRSFATLVVPSYRDIFSDLLRVALLNKVRESGRLQLLRIGSGPLSVKLTATKLASTEPLVLLTVQDLNDRDS